MQDRHVQFQIEDIYHPDWVTILKQLYGKALLQGTVVGVSESGGNREAFVVVEVPGLAQPVVVPIRCIKEAL